MIITSKFNNGKIGIKNYNPIDIITLKKYLDSGYTLKQMADKFNVGIDKIRNTMRKNNLKFIVKTEKINQKEFEYYYYETNFKVNEICKKLNISINLFYKLKNKFQCKNKGCIYFKRNKDIILQKQIEKRKKWQEDNKEDLWKKNRAYYRKKYYNDKEYRWKENFRLSIRERIKLGNGKKLLKTEQLLGCKISELRDHLEKQFDKKMTWDNYGFRGWHIDHIIPCAKFNLTKEEDQKKCFHYTNLQPLWWQDNLRKRDKI